MLKNIRAVAIVSSFEGLIAFIWLVSIPTSGGTFSPVRLISLFGILLITLSCLVVFVYVKSENFFTRKTEKIAKGKVGIYISFLLTTISLTLWVAVLYKNWLLSFMDETVYARSLPLVIFGVLFCLQIGIVFLLPNISMDTWVNNISPVWKPTLILLGCFSGIWALMSLTHIGFTFDNVGLSWGPPGTPISFPQITLVFSICTMLAFAYSIVHPRISPKMPFRDIAIFIGLWTLAVILWGNTPVSATHFNPPPMPPNNETYPNSDALIFDRSAYHLLYGIGFRNQLIRRPLYVGMLALFHGINGFGYENTIFLQILFLAFIPSLVYLLTSKLSNRLAGLIAGGLTLLREKNAIELSDKIVTSNAKLMMSDMIAMLGVIAFVYVAIKIVSKKESNIWSLAIVGACLGLTALIRTQVLILFPPLILLLLLYKKPFPFGVKDSLFVTLGLVLVMLPWVWRNWNLTGTFVLDDRGEERLLARNYSSNPVALLLPQTNESEQEFSARLKRDILAFAVEHPSEVAFFVSNHFFRNLATSAVFISPSLSTDTPRDLINRTSLWDDWQGNLNGNNGIAIFMTITLVAFGIAVAQVKNKSAGSFPIIVLLFYSAGNGLARSSGWRFSLPVDWVTIVYYSIALASLPSQIKFTLNKNHGYQAVSETFPPQTSYLGFIVLCILFLLGASVPIAERVIPVRDFSDVTQEARDKLSHQNVLSPSEIDTFLEQDNAVLLSGIALYPRYITQNSRISLPDTLPKDAEFLHFWLINEGDNQIIFRTQTPPDIFPHASTVSILGRKEHGYILAQVIILHSSQDQIFVEDRQPSIICSVTASAPSNCF